jgi:hypothetical protein
VPEPTLFDRPRDGWTYDNGRDRIRLNAQHLRVYRAMYDGSWWTLRTLSEFTGDPESSISARLRDFRKPRFGDHMVERRHVEGGLWKYRLIWNEDIPRPNA